MSEIEKKWYVLRAISGKETKVKEYLEADIKNSDLGDYVSQVLIPTEKVYQVRNGKKIVKERSYLPGYVLVEAALVGEVAHHLRNTPNVIGFLGGSEKPVPLRQSEVNRILGTVDELQDAGEELNIPYVVGETVKVNYGPFSGFSGIIEEVNTEKKKLKVMVKIFGRKTPLELGFMQVEKVKFGYIHYSATPTFAQIASEAANRQNKFWEFHDSLYTHKGYIDSITVYNIAHSTSMDINKFKKDIEDDAGKKLIEKSINQLVLLGVYATPTIIVNGRLIVNSNSKREICHLIDEELSK